MALPGLVAAKNLSDVADRERTWDNLGNGFDTEFVIGSPGLIVELYESPNSLIDQPLNPFATLIKINRETIISFTQQYDIDNGGNGEFFALKIYGEVQASTTGTNNFTVTADDGVRVWFNNVQVVNQWNYQGATPFPFAVGGLIAGQWYPIEIHFFQGPGPAFLGFTDGNTGAPITALRLTNSVAVNLSIKGADVLALEGVNNASVRDFVLIKGLTSLVQPRLTSAAAAAASGSFLRDNALLKASPTSEGNYTISGSFLDAASLRVNNITVASIATTPFSGSTAINPLFINTFSAPTNFRFTQPMTSGTISTGDRAIPIEGDEFILYAKAGQG